MAGTGEVPTFVYVVIDVVDGKSKVFQDFETFASHYRLKELNPEFYTDDIIAKTKANIDRESAVVGSEPTPVVATINGKLETLYVERSVFIASRSGGRRSRRTLRRHNTLHRNVRRNHVK